MKQRACPVAHLVREALRLETKCIEADEEGNKIEAERAEEALNAIRDAISYLQPQTSTDTQYMLELVEINADSMIDPIFDRDVRIKKLCAIRRMSSAISEFLAEKDYGKILTA